MASRILQDAWDYEAETEKKIRKEDRPGFHLSSRVGWMNDPNGFSFYKGEYHLFYQYYPYDVHWGPMHWGHAVSRDLLHWRYEKCAMAPDMEFDKGGCFSGSAVTLPDGRHLLLYTGVIKETQPDGSVRDIQTQCAAVGDGIEYAKYPENPVITEKNLPAGSSRYDFRDPKIWRKADGSYRLVAGGCTVEGDGQILLYSSPDGVQWQYEKILMANNGRFGRMWECPDFFVLDGYGVLLASPTDMLPDDLEYYNGNGTLCLIGAYEEETDTFKQQYDQAIDHGLDFYAPQTMEAPDGRRIMVGWMQNWDTCNQHVSGLPWCGQMSLPRELSIVNKRLIQRPVRELENLHGVQVKYENVVLSDGIRLEGIRGRKVDMEISLRPGKEGNGYRKFTLYFAQDAVYHTAVRFYPEDSVVELDRAFAGSRRAVVHQCRTRVQSSGGKVKLRIILDSFSAEVFINDGEKVMSAMFYTDLSADDISFAADGQAVMDIVKYDLCEM